VKFAGVVLTCEHASARVPERYSRAFADARARQLLETHAASDLGARRLTHLLARRLEAGSELEVVGPLDGKVTRLLVDLNRSVHHPGLFSDRSRSLPLGERQLLLDRYYWPHQRRVRQAIERVSVNRGVALHLAIHSFTPVWGNELRNADVGLLYDPRRKRELEFCDRLNESLLRSSVAIRVRRNYPYRGAADGLTTALRRERRPAKYIGIELELNQASVEQRGFARAIVEAVVAVMQSR
jgi:predicted N-formylglutamate amidohydrolase